jgi:hypothetical protein
MISLLEKNNYLLIKTNTNLSEQLDEQKVKHELLIKNFNTEVNLIKERLDFYKSNLDKVLNSFYEGKNINQ